MTTLVEPCDQLVAMKEIAEMVDKYHETASAAINERRFNFDEHVGVYFTSSYTEVVDGVRGNRTTLREFWNGVAEKVKASDATLGELPMTYYDGRHLAEDYVLSVATVPVSVTYGDGGSDSFYYVLSLLCRRENGRWLIDHTHRETRQSL